MQKMKRNSMLTGLITGLLIGAVMCFIVYMAITKTTRATTEEEGTPIMVNVLNRNVKSGETITIADVITKTVNSSSSPIDAVTLSDSAIAKIDLSAGTVLGASMLTQAGKEITADLREQEYNMITLPSELTQNDFIDIRLQLPNGGDYIVISKKQVEKCNTSSLWLKMNEEEILTMSNAIIEYYIMAGSKLYATKYTDANIQEASVPTYCPNAEVVALINGNKNITSEIKDGEGRFSQAMKEIRSNAINKELSKYNESKLSNIETKIQEEIASLKKSRESYFGTLNAAQ